MDTPMAVDTRARASNRSRAEVAAERDAKVPLRGRMGTAWDVANGIVNLTDPGRLFAAARLERGSTIGEQRTLRPEPPRHRHNEHTTAV